MGFFTFKFNASIHKESLGVCPDRFTDIGDRCVGTFTGVTNKWDDGKYGAVRQCIHNDAELVSWKSLSEWMQISILVREDYLWWQEIDDHQVPDYYWTGANKLFGSVWEFYDDDTDYNHGRVSMDYGWAEGQPEADGLYGCIDGNTGKLTGTSYCWGYVFCQAWN